MFKKRIFSALADPNRQAILTALRKKELAVTDIAKYVDISPATLSHHLDILKKADLVSARRSGRQIFYSLNLSVLEEISEALIKFIGSKKNRP